MRHKNFIVGMVVGAMLAGAGFVAGTVDARPRRPGARPPPKGAPKRVPGPKKKETTGKIPVVYECPADNTMGLMQADKVGGMPSGWTQIPLSMPLYFDTSSLDSYGTTLRCTYKVPSTHHAAVVSKKLDGTDCVLSANKRKVTCYK